MSDFSDKLNRCMNGKGLPAPNLETVGKAVEILHFLESAWEAGGGETETLIGDLLAPSSAGLSEEAVDVLSAAATVAVSFYINSAVSCIASNAFPDLKVLLASNPPDPGYLRDQFASAGVLTDAGDTAVA